MIKCAKGMQVPNRLSILLNALPYAYIPDKSLLQAVVFFLLGRVGAECEGRGKGVGTVGCRVRRQGKKGGGGGCAFLFRIPPRSQSEVGGSAKNTKIALGRFQTRVAALIGEEGNRLYARCCAAGSRCAARP